MNPSSGRLLLAKQVTYGSANDERAFFEWLGRIEGIESVKGVGDELTFE